MLKDFIKEEAKRGQAYYVTQRWLGGTLTNFKNISKSIKKLNDNLQIQKSGEIEKYTKDMQEILEFANMINDVNTEGLNETIAANEKCNVLRKDEVRNFANRELLLQNAPSQDEGMFRIPKVIN